MMKATLNPIMRMRNINKSMAKKVDDIPDDATEVCSSLDFNSNHSTSRYAAPRVQFFDDDLLIQAEHECTHDLSVEEIAQELWYTPQEQREMKEANNFSAKVARSASSEYSKALTSTYESCCEQHATDDEDDDTLRSQLQLQPARTGMESKVCKALSQDKQARRQQLLDLLSQNKADNELASACAAITRPARIFATRLAKAQMA